MLTCFSQPKVSTKPESLIVERSAIMTPDRVRRYLLSRTVSREGRTWLFVGLNPSTANAEDDDPTVRRLIGFTRRWGYGSVLVCNLFSLISPDPDALRRHEDPVGPSNDDHLRAAVGQSSLVVAGWGAYPQAKARSKAVLASGILGPDVQCFGRNGDGSPKHPLYLRSDVRLEPLEQRR